VASQNLVCSFHLPDSGEPSDLTIELVEVAIHTILYVRQIYPAELFVRRKKYDTPVFQSRHPALNEYISGAVKAVGEELKLVGVFTASIIGTFDSAT
jgi:hypothetical protein